MPAAYTHYKFGQEVLFHLSNKKLREVIAHYPKMFDLGLYGPDILFYHGIPGKKELNYLGFSLHKEKAADFFVYAKDIVELRKKEDELKKAQLDGLDVYSAGNADLNFVFDRYIATKKELASSTYANYIYMYDRYVRDGFGKKKVSEAASWKQ